MSCNTLNIRKNPGIAIGIEKTGRGHQNIPFGLDYFIRMLTFKPQRHDPPADILFPPAVPARPPLCRAAGDSACLEAHKRRAARFSEKMRFSILCPDPAP